MAEERISELKDMTVEHCKIEEQRGKKMRKAEQNMQKLWDSYEKHSIRVLWILDGEKRKAVFEARMTENFLKLKSKTGSQNQEA